MIMSNNTYFRMDFNADRIFLSVVQIKRLATAKSTVDVLSRGDRKMLNSGFYITD